jgi:predicted dehydrogenase
MTTSSIRWGILGCGKIARKFAHDLALAPGSELVAAGSHDGRSAKAFAQEFPVKKVHSSYQSLVEDKDVDVIYVATPHGLHHEHTLLCLKHRKAVLCEKAFALNQQQALVQMIRENKLGPLENVLINFGFVPTPPLADRIFDPSLGGGSLLDIGIYNVFFALSALGKPDHIEASMTPASTGVDEQCAVTFSYPNGAMAQLFSSFSSPLATEADFSGKLGRLRLTRRFYEPSTQIEFFPTSSTTGQLIPVEKESGWGYQYQIRHVQDCLRKGLTESPVMTHQDTLDLMEVLDAIRKKAGIRYPADQTL